MTRKNWNAEGGTNGTTITTGNSGGASGDAWNLVSLSGQTGVYTSTSPIHDTLSMRLADASGAAGGVQVGWTDTASASCAVRWYEKWATLPSTANMQHGLNLRGNAGATTLVRREVNTDGTWRFVMSTTSAFAATALVVGTVYRFECQITGAGAGTNAAAGSMAVYLGDSTTPQDTINLSSQTLSLTIDTVRFGKFQTAGLSDTMFDSLAADVGTSVPIGGMSTVTPGWSTGYFARIG